MSTEGVSWEIRFPLLTNRYFLWDFAKAVAATEAILFVIFGVITRDLVQTFQMIGISTAILVPLMVLACLLLGNGYNATFYVGTKGIAYGSGSTEQKWNRAAFILGLFAGKPGVAGAGALGMSGESGSYTWKELQFITVDEPRRVISLHNNWRTLNRLYCTPENFAAVMAEFEKRLPKSKITSKPW
jgi:hypothetical protein